jgi:hypothetical protein
MDWLDAITIVLALLVALLALRNPLHKPAKRCEQHTNAPDDTP